MTKGGIEVALSGATFLILFVGLVFAIVQTMHANASIKRTKFNALQSDLQEVNRVFIQYPEMQKYFLTGQDISMSDPNYSRAYAIAVAIAMNMDESTDDLKGNEDLLEPGVWDAYYRFQFSASPLLCRLLAQDHDLYGRRIVAIAGRDCHSTSRRPINPP